MNLNYKSRTLPQLYAEIYTLAEKLIGMPDIIEDDKRTVFIYHDIRIIKKVSGRCRVDIYNSLNHQEPLTNKFLLSRIAISLSIELLTKIPDYSSSKKNSGTQNSSTVPG